MSYSIPESLLPLRARLLAFMDEHIYPNERLLLGGTPEGERLEKELIGRAKAQGLFAMGHPVSMGGGGLSWLENAYVYEVIGRSDAAMDVFGSYSLQTCLMLDRAATPAQRAALVGPLAAGDLFVAFSVTEPGAASSDPTSIQTTAVLDGDHWVINGRKWYVSHGSKAQWICVMCRTEPEGTPAHQAFSMILVPAGTPGLRIVRDLKVMGLPRSDHPEFEYADVRVPAANLLGRRGEGFELFQVRLGPARITNCMRWLGQAQRAFDLMCARINERKLAGGTPLATRQLMQQHVYDSYVQLQSARMLVLDAAARLGRGEEARVEVSAVKVQCSRMLHDVIDRALQVHGALGVSDLTPLEYMYRMARIYRIVDGPDEVHIERVGRNILRDYARGSPWDFGLH
ncbi:MAG: acyl-CoA dehydrogenase family protein [Gammaproteobacteria bacterium]